MISRNENVKLSFKVNAPESSVIAKRGERTTLRIDVTNGVVICYTYYDFNDNPLILTYNVT